MTILRILACLTIALCTVQALLRLEGLPPDEADALWREAFDDALRFYDAPSN